MSKDDGFKTVQRRGQGRSAPLGSAYEMSMSVLRYKSRQGNAMPLTVAFRLAPSLMDRARLRLGDKVVIKINRASRLGMIVLAEESNGHDAYTISGHSKGVTVAGRISMVQHGNLLPIECPLRECENVVVSKGQVMFEIPKEAIFPGDNQKGKINHGGERQRLVEGGRIGQAFLGGVMDEDGKPETEKES